MKLRDKIERLRATAPNKDAGTGMLYADADALRHRYKKITLHVLLVSSENTHMLHATVFEKTRPLAPEEWRAWLSVNFQKVYATGVLPGIGIRTEGKQWSVQHVLGWIPYAKSKSRTAAMGRAGNKTKRQGRKNGKANIRRRQRNRKRKAK